jgi:glycosyltransferase involved in cell wall biosynthesis
MLISFITPAYNASNTIQRTLDSVFASALPMGWELEFIVVDDGSRDGDALKNIVGNYPLVRYFRLPENQGKIGAMNFGIAHTSGEIVLILDADDEMVQNWPSVFSDILKEWPESSSVLFAGCVNQNGETTVDDPSYSGFFTLNDMLNERRRGEYLPVFRGHFIRENPYLNWGGNFPGLSYTYIDFAQKSPFFISKNILRIYHDNMPHSVTSHWGLLTRCVAQSEFIECLLSRYGALYQEKAPRGYRARLLRLSCYRHWGHLPGVWSAFAKGISFLTIKESIAAFFCILLPPKLAKKIVWYLKKNKIGLPRYG